MHSTLKSIDAHNRQITVHPSQSFPEVRKTLTIGHDAVIKLNGEPCRLKDLRKGDWLHTVGESPCTWVAARRFGETKGD